MKRELKDMIFNVNPIERVTQGTMTIDSNHAQIHAGNAYSLGEVITITAGATVDVTVYVPTGTYVHYQASDISTDGGQYGAGYAVRGGCCHCWHRDSS